MRNTVVVDANIALKWIFNEEDSHIALALLRDWSKQRIVVQAPVLLTYEVTNILYQKKRRGLISIERVKDAQRELLLLGLEFDFPQDHTLSRRAVELAHKYDLPATYDTHYLALAEREDCEFWTADTRMWRTVQGKLPWVRNLHEYRSANDQDED